MNNLTDNNNNNSNKVNGSNLLAAFWILLGTIARIVPHLPNFTPTTSICLFSGARLSKKQAIGSVAILMVASDILLSKIHGLEPFGWWSLFTYSGFLTIILTGVWLRKNSRAPRLLGLTLASTIFFWIWTNFGTWLSSGMYSLDSAGLSQCFALALPFLGPALVGDLVWSLVFFLSYEFASKRITARTASTAACEAI